MKTLIASLALALASTANATSIVAPGAEYATTEGGTSRILMGHPDAFHIQLIFSRTLFGADPINMTGFAWRYDSSVYQGQIGSFPINWGNSVIKMATISSMGAAVETYAQNLGADTKTVLNGALLSVLDAGGPVAGPRNWNNFSFATPFTYDPALGDLVMDVEMLEESTSFLNADWVDNTTTGISVYSFRGGARGMGSTSIPVTRLDFDLVPPTPGGGPSTGPGAVPEPASWAMLLFGFGIAGGALRRSSRRARPHLA
jgi:hypothetical protein